MLLAFWRHYNIAEFINSNLHRSMLKVQVIDILKDNLTKDYTKV